MSSPIFLDKIIFVIPEPLVSYNGQYVKDLIHLPEALSKSALERSKTSKESPPQTIETVIMAKAMGIQENIKRRGGFFKVKQKEEENKEEKTEEQESSSSILKRLHDKKCNNWIYLIEKEVASQIQYQFSNKRVVTLIDILFHSYKKYVPSLLLPLERDLSEKGEAEAQEEYSLSSSSYSYHSFHLNSRISLKRSYSKDFNELNKMIFLLLNQWDKILSHKRPPLYLVFETDPSEKRRALEIKKIEFLSFQQDGPMEIALQKGWPATGNAQIRYQTQKSDNTEKHKLLLQNAFIDRKKQILSFHDHAYHHHRLLKEEQGAKAALSLSSSSRSSRPPKKSMEKDINRKEQKRTADKSQIQLYGHEELHKHFMKGSFAFPSHWQKESLSCEGLWANLDEKGFMQFKAFFLHKGQKFHLYNIGQEALLLLSTLNHGLSPFKKNIQSHPQAASICRHKGIAHFLFMKYGDLFLKNETPLTESTQLKESSESAEPPESPEFAEPPESPEFAESSESLPNPLNPKKNSSNPLWKRP